MNDGEESNKVSREQIGIKRGSYESTGEIIVQLIFQADYNFL